ncbi:hypothetical protein IAR50_003748 [Cryptococcus sp. DSM 104548]
MSTGQWALTENPSSLPNPPRIAPQVKAAAKPSLKRKADPAPKAFSSSTAAQLPSPVGRPRAPPKHTLNGDQRFYPPVGQQAEGSSGGSGVASGSRPRILSAYQAAKQKQAEDGNWSDEEDSDGCGYDGDLEILVNGVPRGQKLAQESWAVIAQILQNPSPTSPATLEIKTEAERNYQALLRVSKHPGPHQEYPWDDRMSRLLMFYTYVSDVGDKMVCARACNSLRNDYSARGLRELLGDAEYFEATGSLIRSP